MEAVGGVMAILLVVLAILWIMLPFLIMGTNKRLDKIDRKLKRIGEIMKNRMEKPEEADDFTNEDY